MLILCAAHNADGAASESLVMNETRVHVVITDVRKGDRPHASSVVNVPSRAGQARFRAAASSECCRFVKHAARSLVCGDCGCRAPTGWAKARPETRTRGKAYWDHRSRDSGTESSSSRVNWGPSACCRAVGISNDKPAVTGRSSDVAIVSQEAGGQNNRWRSQGPLGGCVVSEAVDAAGPKARLRNLTDTDEISTVSALKPPGRRTRLTARLKPYWGKPAVRNFRGSRGNGMNELTAICHKARKGGHIGSRCSNHTAPLLYSTNGFGLVFQFVLSHVFACFAGSPPSHIQKKE
jgi:hypothetical protein